MAVVVDMVLIDTTALLVMEPLRTQVLDTARVAMEDWGGQTATRPQQQKTSETLYLEAPRIGMHSGLPSHQATGGQVVVTLQSRGRLATRVGMAHMEKKDSSQPKRKRKRMSQQLSSKSAS
jgi:hypothetical protein